MSTGLNGDGGSYDGGGDDDGSSGDSSGGSSFSPPDWFSTAAAFFSTGSAGYILAVEGPREFFSEFLIPFISETLVGWILTGITRAYAELVGALRAVWQSFDGAFITPTAQLGASVEEIVDSWTEWQITLLEGAALEMGLAGPFVMIVVYGIVIVANVALASILWDIADDYVPLQVVTGPIRGSIETAREAFGGFIDRVAPPYRQNGGNTDE